MKPSSARHDARHCMNASACPVHGSTSSDTRSASRLPRMNARPASRSKLISAAQAASHCNVTSSPWRAIAGSAASSSRYAAALSSCSWVSALSTAGEYFICNSKESLHSRHSGPARPGGSPLVGDAPEEIPLAGSGGRKSSNPRVPAFPPRACFGACRNNGRYRSRKMRVDDLHQRIRELDIVGDRIDHCHLAGCYRIKPGGHHARRIDQRTGRC